MTTKIPRNLSWKAWKAWGRKLTKTQSYVNWKLAFWLLYGEMRWGDDYIQIAEDLHVSRHTLWRAASIARAFELVPSTVLFPDDGRTIPFWNCEPIANGNLSVEERTEIVQDAINRNLSQSEIKRIVKEKLESRLKALPPAAQTGFSAGLKNGPKEDDGLPIPPHGVKREEPDYDALQERIKALEGVNTELREQVEVLSLAKADKAQTRIAEIDMQAEDSAVEGMTVYTPAQEAEIAALNDAARVNLNVVVEQQNVRIRELEQEVFGLGGQLAVYCKIRPYLERIVACLAENEEIGDWLRTAAETLEEEKAFYEAGK